MGNNGLDGLVQELALARAEVEAIQRTISGLQAKIEATELGAELKASGKAFREARGREAEAEQALRCQAIRDYDGDKRPHEKASIRIVTVVDYDEEEALEHCRQHLPQALRLDKRIFVKAARAVPPPFVTIVEEPRATIARDLSTYVRREEGVLP